MAQDLDYIPMPEGVVKQIEAAWKKDVKDELRQANLLILLDNRGKGADRAFPHQFQTNDRLRSCVGAG